MNRKTLFSLWFCLTPIQWVLNSVILSHLEGGPITFFFAKVTESINYLDPHRLKGWELLWSLCLGLIFLFVAWKWVYKKRGIAVLSVLLAQSTGLTLLSVVAFWNQVPLQDPYMLLGVLSVVCCGFWLYFGLRLWKENRTFLALKEPEALSSGEQKIRRRWLYLTFGSYFLGFAISLFVSKSIGGFTLVSLMAQGLLVQSISCGIAVYCAYLKKGTKLLLFMLIFMPISWIFSLAGIFHTTHYQIVGMYGTGLTLIQVAVSIWYYLATLNLRRLNKGLKPELA